MTLGGVVHTPVHTRIHNNNNALKRIHPCTPCWLAGLKTNERGVPSFAVLYSNKYPVDDSADTRSAQGTKPSAVCACNARRCLLPTKDASISPFQRRQAHDVQTGNALPPLLVVQLTALPAPRALDLVLVPHLIVVPYLLDGERVFAILLVSEQE